MSPEPGEPKMPGGDPEAAACSSRFQRALVAAPFGLGDLDFHRDAWPAAHLDQAFTQPRRRL
jgi:hypothetical protein